MKKLILLALALVASVASVYAAGKLENDANDRPISGFAPESRRSVSLTVASQTVDMSNDLAWKLYTPNDCKFRVMSTATKAGSQHTWIGGAWDGRVVKKRSAFVNFSGCTSGELQRQ